MNRITGYLIIGRSGEYEDAWDWEYGKDGVTWVFNTHAAAQAYADKLNHLARQASELAEQDEKVTFEDVVYHVVEKTYEFGEWK